MTETERRNERLYAAWHAGLGAMYLLALAFHIWSTWEHARVGFRQET